MLKSILVLFLMLVPTVSHAGIDERFAEFFFSSEISARHCGANISNFMKFLSEKGESVEDITIVSITAPAHPWSFYNVPAVNSRWGNEVDGMYHQNFDFHVIAIQNGYVYDFTFGQTPLVLPLKKYMQKMFVPPVAFAINGSTFRVRGEGPMYTPKHAEAELKNYQFKIMSTNAHGVFTEIKSKVSFIDFMKQHS